MRSISAISTSHCRTHVARCAARFAKSSLQVLSVAGIVNVHIGVSYAGADGEAVQAVVRFGPPAVQNGEV